MAWMMIKKSVFANAFIVRKTAAVNCNAARHVVTNFDFKPGPYPRTPEERAAAAKKYGLTVEEYKTFPEDMGYGDYPNLPDIGADSKDPHYPYDYPEHRRNFNEPLHHQFELIGLDRYDPSLRPRVPVWQMWITFLGTIAAFSALFFFLEKDEYRIQRPVTAKQYVQDGPHYTFSPKS